MPEFRLSVVIDATEAPHGHLHHARFITAHSLPDAGRRVVAALKLIDEPKEESPNEHHPTS